MAMNELVKGVVAGNVERSDGSTLNEGLWVGNSQIGIVFEEGVGPYLQIFDGGSLTVRPFAINSKFVQLLDRYDAEPRSMDWETLYEMAEEFKARKKSE